VSPNLPRPVSTILVASTGGHLSELYKLAPRMPALEPPFHWVTFETPQSRALLADESVTWARYTGQRDYRGVADNLPLANRLLDRSEVSAVVSTGAAIAASFLPLARAKRIRAHYVEGIARTEGPSTTGRMLQPVPGIRFYTQWADWATDRWTYRGSVFDSFSAADGAAEGADIGRVVVMLGTMPYSFRRLVDRLREILPPEAHVTWQTGETPVNDLPIEAHRALPPAELDRAIAQADVVVGHAGGGSALQVMEAGKCPVIVPREAAHNEHVDDHQLQIAEFLPRLGLAVSARVDELTWDHVARAAATRVSTVGHPPDFELD
jgi:UDP-N-acetylglucosamine--N-acetylmuramyl-(pentapeptide) pyrophosphoryl-undecaprenol N-acetylglucosamine transferase